MSLWEQYSVFNETPSDKIENLSHAITIKSKEISKYHLTKYTCEKCNATLYSINDKRDEAHNDNHMTEIIPGLYLGAVYNAHNRVELMNGKIDTIVNAAYEVQNKFHDAIKYKKLMWDDIGDQDILTEMDDTLKLIHTTLSNGKRVLVHCYMGKSRSVSIVVAYLIRYNNMSLSAALKFVKDKRFIAMPNDGFMEQLKKFK